MTYLICSYKINCPNNEETPAKCKLNIENQQKSLNDQ